MNERERFSETVKFGSPDRFPYWEYNLFPDRWYKEGIPIDVNPLTYLGLEKLLNSFWSVKKPWGAFLPINIGSPFPPFDEVVLEDTGRCQVRINSSGVKVKIFRNASGFISRQFLEFPVKNREDFIKVKKRYRPDSPTRYPERWEDLKGYWKDRDYSLGLHLQGLFWWVRNLMGLYGACVCFHRDPDLIHEMMDFLVEYQLETIHRVFEEVKLDYALIVEDMAYKTGPMISPQMVRRFILPRYKKMTSFLRKHGIDTIMVDSDGNLDLLIPIWIEAGINMVLPCEVAAGNDVVVLRERYPKLILFGGIDKRTLYKGQKAIEKEVMSKVPLLQETGGYIPSLDHAVPPDVPLQNFLYYRNLIRKLANHA